MKTESPAADLLDAILPGLSLMETIERDKAEVSRLKTEYEAAKERADTYTKTETREKIRAKKRRDEIIGHLFEIVCVTSPETWAEFQPHLRQWLERADDADRTLFKLPPKKVAEPPKVETELPKVETEPPKVEAEPPKVDTEAASEGGDSHSK